MAVTDGKDSTGSWPCKEGTYRKWLHGSMAVSPKMRLSSRRERGTGPCDHFADCPAEVPVFAMYCTCLCATRLLLAYGRRASPRGVACVAREVTGVPLRSSFHTNVVSTWRFLACVGVDLMDWRHRVTTNVVHEGYK